jgi:hypothetical protein
MAYLREGWTMLKRGPYWQIRERARVPSLNAQAAEGDSYVCARAIEGS